MGTRPDTARSEISSAISEDGHGTPPPSSAFDRSPAKSSTSASQQAGFAHLRGVTSPTNRTIRSPPPPTPTTIGGSSRPQSPESTTSRTHVPSLTAQGFLRPMTSSRLQQQRLNNLRAARQVNNPLPPPAPPKDGESDFDDQLGDLPPHGHRHNHSVTTGYTDSEAAENYESQSQQFQDDTDRGFVATSAKDDIKQAPAPLNLHKAHQKTTSPLRSPHSFRSAFSIGSKQFFEPPGHQHLPSSENSPRYPEIHEKQQQPLSRARHTTVGKNYEYFLGNTIFFMGGRLQNARDRPINLMTLVLLVLPCVLFFVYSAPWLWHHVSPAIPIVFAYIFYVCLSSFIHASLTDPGIYPRYIHPFPDQDPADALAVGPPTNDWVMVRLATSETAAMDVPVKYCKTCDIWRPPRCYHCRVCDNCVETLDHHCVWLNNCVGRRNYRYFFAFVSSGTILSLLLAFGSLGQVIAYRDQNHVSFVSAMDHNRVPFAMFLYGVLAVVYPILLWGYHLILTGRGETTREYLASRRFPKHERHRPFTLGNIIKNWIVVLARPRPPTYMHFKRQYQDGDQRLGSVRGGRGRSPRTEGPNGAGMELKPVNPAQKSFEGPTGKIAKKEAR